MRFFEDIIQQVTKTGYRVCGDHVMCYRKVEVTYLVVADGIGSGVYCMAWCEYENNYCGGSFRRSLWLCIDAVS